MVDRRRLEFTLAQARHSLSVAVSRRQLAERELADARQAELDALDLVAAAEAAAARTPSQE